jgi:hypothetical protein
VLYGVTPTGLIALLAQSKEAVTDSLIIYTGPQIAESLFVANEWDCRSLRLHTLSMGLKYTQLGTISILLGNLFKMVVGFNRFFFFKIIIIFYRNYFMIFIFHVFSFSSLFLSFFFFF